MTFMKIQSIKKYFIVGIAIILWMGTAYVFTKRDFFGMRLNLDVRHIETANYASFAPNIAFKYPTIFEIDNDEQNKYGNGYVVGIKLKTDMRTGCDVRIDGPKMDFSQDTEKLTQLVTKEISQNAKDFTIIEKKKVKIDGRDGFKVAFSFLDPIGARVQLEQIFVRDHDVDYFIICGTGEYQYDFFKKDFDVFFDSIDFDGNIDDLEK